MDARHRSAIPAFYPIEERFEVVGRRRKTQARKRLGRAGRNRARENFGRPKFSRKSVQGDRATGHSPMLDQPALAWGASSLVTGGTGQIGSGDGSKQPTVKSSTMRGAKALASKFCVRRCRNVNGVGWPVRGSFLLLPPEIIGRIESDGKYGAAGAAAYSQGPEG